MELAKITSKGQITIPKPIRQKLGDRDGDKVVFWENEGRIYILNSAMVALQSAQEAFAGEADHAGLRNEDDLTSMIKDLRKERTTVRAANN